MSIAPISTQKGLITVRPAQMEDAAAFRELRLRALREHPVAFTADYDANLAHPIEYWVQRLASQGRYGHIYFAVHETGLVGMTGIQMGDSPKTRHSAVIWGVYVLPEWRSMGIVDALFEACMAWSREHGVVVAKLGVTANNAPAVRAYLRLGFSIYGVEPQVVMHAGEVFDELLMARKI